MWRLLLQDGRSVPLRELPATLGRDDAASVRVRHPSIAPLHARLRAGVGDQLVIEAVGEALVLAGGHATRSAALSDGDTLVLGELAFTVRRDAAASAAPEVEQISMRAQAAAAADPGAPARAASAEPQLKRRGKTLHYSKEQARTGLLHADLSQLSFQRRALVWLVVLLVAGALATGIALLFGALR